MDGWLDGGVLKSRIESHGLTAGPTNPRTSAFFLKIRGLNRKDERVMKLKSDDIDHADRQECRQTHKSVCFRT